MMKELSKSKNRARFTKMKQQPMQAVLKNSHRAVPSRKFAMSELELGQGAFAIFNQLAAMSAQGLSISLEPKGGQVATKGHESCGLFHVLVSLVPTGPCINRTPSRTQNVNRNSAPHTRQLEASVHVQQVVFFHLGKQHCALARTGSDKAL